MIMPGIIIKIKISAIKPYIEVTSYLKNEFPYISLNAGHDFKFR